MKNNKNEIAAIIEGAKGGGGSAPPELPNTLASRAVLKVQILTSEGPIEGLPGGPQAIYINDTPLQNSDGTFNFQNIQYDWRIGSPDQTNVPGFNEAFSLVNVGATLTTAAPVIRESSHDKVDAMKIIATANEGLMMQENGQLKPTEVILQVHRKLSATSAWEYAGDILFSGKTDSPTQKQFRVERPTGLGKWQYRVTRVTPDSTISGIRNGTQIAAHTEYQKLSNTYPNCAYVTLSVDSEAVGGTIPNIAILTKGLIVRVPSNYDPETRLYAGAFWDGSFKNAHTDNPAWILYDLITNTRYGLAASGHVNDSMVNKYSFYDAAVYNDGLVPVPVSESASGYEPRFTFNYPMSSREDVWKHLTSVAGAMHCTIIQVNGQICLSQDRPEAPSMIITKANVSAGEDGEKAPFTYKGTSKDERQTSFNITYNDRKNRFLPAITVVEDQAYIDARGLRVSNIAAFGTTTVTQAIRHGKWALYTSQNQTEIVQFSMGMNGYDLIPGKIVSIWDEDYTDKRGGGRVVSATTNTFTTDRTIDVGIGAVVQVMLADGKTIEQRNIVNNQGTYSTFTVSQAFSQAVLPNADYIVMSAIKPRQFRITSAMAADGGLVDFEAVFHDPNKYSYVELGIAVPAPVYSDAKPTMVSAVRDLTAREFTINDNNVITRSILVSWAPPALGIAGSYRVSWRKLNEDWQTMSVTSTSCTIANVDPATYEIIVVGLSAVFNQAGPVSTFILSINTNGGGQSLLSPVTELRESQTGSTTQFLGLDLNVSWLNPVANASVGVAIRDFKVDVIDADTNAVVYQTYVAGVAPGARQSFTFTYGMNLNSGGARRRLKVSVRARDTSNNLSLETFRTFVNPPPALITDWTVSSGIGVIYVNLANKPADIDYAGILIYRGTTSDFALLPQTLVFQGDSTQFTDSSAVVGTTYYYRVAAYDDFGFGGLNVAASKSGTAFKSPGVAGGTSFPTSPSNGDSFYRTDLEKLYFYKDGVWKLTGVNSGPTLPATGTAGDIFSNTTDGKLYRYVNGAWTAAIPAVDLVGQITATQITDGAISTPKLSAGAVTALNIAAGTITSTQIAADTIVAGNIQTGAIGADELAASSVIAGKVAANAISAANIVAGTITGDRLTGNTITGDKVQTRTLNASHIAVGSLTADVINVGAAINLLPNSTFSERPQGGLPTGWGFSSNLTNARVGTEWPSPYNLLNGVSIYIAQENADYNGFPFYERNAQAFSPLVPVVPGVRYEYSIFAVGHRAQANIIMQFFDYQNNFIASYGTEPAFIAAGNALILADYTRMGSFVVAPANAAYGRIVVIKGPPVNAQATSSFLFATYPLLGAATPNQSVLSPWNPTGLGTRITPNGINTPRLDALSGNMGNLTTGTIDLAQSTEGSWGYIRTPGKWLDNTPGWIVARHPDGSSFFDFKTTGMRFFMRSGAQGEQSILDFGGLSMGSDGVVVMRAANVINTLNIAGNAITAPAFVTAGNVVQMFNDNRDNNANISIYNYSSGGAPIMITLTTVAFSPEPPTGPIQSIQEPGGGE